MTENRAQKNTNTIPYYMMLVLSRARQMPIHPNEERHHCDQHLIKIYRTLFLFNSLKFYLLTSSSISRDVSILFFCLFGLAVVFYFSDGKRNNFESNERLKKSFEYWKKKRVLGMRIKNTRWSMQRILLFILINFYVSLSVFMLLFSFCWFACANHHLNNSPFASTQNAAIKKHACFYFVEFAH